MSSIIVSWFAITSRELNWILTILSSSSSSKVGQEGDTSMTSILIKAAGSRMSFIWMGLETFLFEGGEGMVSVVESREDRALVRSACDGGLGDEAGMGEAGDIGEAGSEPLNDPETVSTQTFLCEATSSS